MEWADVTSSFGKYFAAGEDAKSLAPSPNTTTDPIYIKLGRSLRDIPSHSGGPSGESRLEKLWFYKEALGVAKAVDSNLPTFQHTIAVSVIGGPKATLERIWTLALSTAFGRYRQAGLEGIQGAELEGTWDVTGKSVQVVLSYVNSGAIGLGTDILRRLGLGATAGTLLGQLALPGAGAAVGGVAGAALDRIRGSSNSVSGFLRNGPTQETVGGNTLSWLEAEPVLAAGIAGATLGGTAGYIGGLALTTLVPEANLIPVNIPKTLAAINAAVYGSAAAGLAAGASAANRLRNPLPDAGRVITTAQKNNPNLQPPAPSGDGVSRTAPFIGLVSNALSDPGYLPTSPPQTVVYKKQPLFIDNALLLGASEINKRVKGQLENVPIITAGYGNNLDTSVWPNDGYPAAIPETITDLTGAPNTGV